MKCDFISKEFWPHCAILVDILFYMYFTTLLSCLLSLIWSLFFFIFHYIIPSLISSWYICSKKRKTQKNTIATLTRVLWSKIAKFLVEIHPIPPKFPYEKIEKKHPNFKIKEAFKKIGKVAAVNFHHFTFPIFWLEEKRRFRIWKKGTPFF